MSVGYASLETQQRKWIFQAARAPESTPAELEQAARAGGMESVWIEHHSPTTGRPIRLHALWAGHADPRAPLLLYLHGARRDVGRSTFRVEQMRELGFSVLAVDYRGFGNSTDELPSEAGVVEDAEAAWRWLAEHRAGAAALRLRPFARRRDRGAARRPARRRRARRHAAGRDRRRHLHLDRRHVRTFKWGWLPISMLITERFDSLAAVPRIKSPLMIVHGSDDALVPSRFGQRLYEQATVAKRFVLIEGGTHSTTTWRGAEQYRAALREFFGVGKAG